MNINDPIGDMLTRIRNAQTRRKMNTRSPNSKMRVRVLEVLLKEGYIRGFTEIEVDGYPTLDIELKYYEGEPVISFIKRVSKPGRRVYSSVQDIPPVRNGLGISIISTPKGVMSDSLARQHNTSGEILCQVS